MIPEGAPAFERLATGAGVPVYDEWERSHLTVQAPQTAEAVFGMNAPGLNVTARIGPEAAPLTVSSPQLRDSEVEELVSLAGNEREAAEIRSATTSADVLRMLFPLVQDVEIHIAAPCWVRTEAALVQAVARNWIHVALSLNGSITIGDQVVELEELRSPYRPTGSLPCHVLTNPATASPTARASLESVADAAAWTQISYASTITGAQVQVTLHDAQAATIVVTPSEAHGGVYALQWLTATEDPNRLEALRHVLRIATLNSDNRLPDGVAVQRLAERQRIALSQERAAEVQRTIVEGQRATTAALQDATNGLGEALDDTTKTTTAAALAVLGVVAFIVKEATATPDFIVIGASTVAVGGVVFVARARWTMLGDRKRAIEHLNERLASDPLLPRSDYEALSAEIEAFRLSRRVASVRAQIVVTAAVTALLTVGAARWVVSDDSDRKPGNLGRTTTTTAPPPSSTPRFPTTTAPNTTAVPSP